MQYLNTIQGTFIDRPNRFIAHVHIDGTPSDQVETVHVKNTGRCKELLIPGAKVILVDEWANGKTTRKTQYDLITVYKESLGWINIDSQVPNKVVMEWLQSDGESVFGPITKVKPEYTFGESRVDYYLETTDRKVLIEVKGCTLEVDGVGYFPDAPTTRGVKHLNELKGALAKGYDSYIAFVIAMPGINRVEPNSQTDMDFTNAYKDAISAGVKVLYFLCDVTENGIICKNCLRKQ